jgi:putative spermidine/putrescine transport system ATP-binding protein
VTVGAAGAAGAGQVAGRVLARSYCGDSVEFLVDTALGTIKGSADAAAAPWAEGDMVSMHLDLARAALIPT